MRRLAMRSSEHLNRGRATPLHLAQDSTSCKQQLRCCALYWDPDDQLTYRPQELLVRALITSETADDRAPRIGSAALTGKRETIQVGTGRGPSRPSGKSPTGNQLTLRRSRGLIVVCDPALPWPSKPRFMYSPVLAPTTRLNALLNAASDS
jgi:hypothetical protein